MNTTGKKFGGRSKGTGNKALHDLRAGIQSFLNKNWEGVQKEYNNLEPKEKLLFIEKLIKYTTPALSNVSATIDYEKLSEEQIDELLKRITGNHG